MVIKTWCRIHEKCNSSNVLFVIYYNYKHSDCSTIVAYAAKRPYNRGPDGCYMAFRGVPFIDRAVPLADGGSGNPLV